MNHATRTSRWTRARAIMALGMALGLGVAVTMAVLTDNAVFTSTFATGTLDLKINDVDGNPETYTLEGWTLENAKTGATSYAPLTVKNAGSIDFNYTMGTATGIDPEDEALAAAIDVTIKTVADKGDCDNENEQGFIEGAEVVPTQSLDKVSIIEPRTLAAEGGSEILCFKAELTERGTTAEVAGKTVSPVFTLTATQA